MPKKKNEENKKLKIGVVGAGASGVLCALLLKRKYPAYDVYLFDHQKKINHKLLVTGNGKCNFANGSKDAYKQYRYPDAFKELVNDVPLEDLLLLFKELCIYSYSKDNLYYPISESSETLAATLRYHLTCERVVEIIDRIESYEVLDDHIRLKGENRFYRVDKVIFANGGASKPKLGSDGLLFDVFKSHNYIVEELKPGLCPLLVKEDVKKISGQRRKVLVSLLVDNKVVYKEKGEILFKDKGISGIVIFNIASIIARNNYKNPVLSINFLADYYSSYNKFMAEKPETFAFLILEGFFSQKLAGYLYDIVKPTDFHTLFDFRLTVKGSYGFEDSQVTVGGVSLNNLNADFSSKIEKNVYFIGEVIDQDGLCGGYNLMWAFLSAMKLVKHF